MKNLYRKSGEKNMEWLYFYIFKRIIMINAIGYSQKVEEILAKPEIATLLSTTTESARKELVKYLNRKLNEEWPWKAGYDSIVKCAITAIQLSAFD